MASATLSAGSGQFARLAPAAPPAVEVASPGAQSLRGHELSGRPGRGGLLSFGLWIALAIVLAAVVADLFQSWKRDAAPATLETSGSTDALRPVTVARPAADQVASVVLPATVRPWQSAALHARVSGYVAAWHHDLGARVKAGDLLARIDTPELDQELTEGEASVHEAEAAAAQAEAERVEAEADLAVAEAQLARVRAEVELAESQAARREKLVEKRAVSREENESFQKNLSVRNADVVAAQSELARRRANLTTRAAVIEARRAAMNSRQANVNRLKELQIFKRIVAPFDGVITRRVAEVGMLVTAGGDSLFAIEDMSHVRVELNVPQTYAAQTVVGAEAGVSLPESPLPAVQATITRVAGSVDAASRTMLAQIELDNATGDFQPGSYAQVALQTRHSGWWTIPANTLDMRVEGPHVAVVNDEERIEIRRISLGRDLGNRVVAVEGIRGDERLVVNPGDGLVHGTRVRVSEPQAPVEEVAAQ